ncbi:MAG: gamma carbonic anhydrase family protein [Actinomycetia bacterium]|nr:gamma carbonic anhydrase family protein [Actinomycetes bacterium]
MLVEHRGERPVVHPDAYVAPNAVICGAVHVAAGVRILFGAVVTAEDGRVEIGANSVVMENALIRGRSGHTAKLGRNVLVGPHSHVNGARVDDGAFLATGVAIFPGAVIGAGSEVRIHAVVHVNSAVAPGSTVPIGWVVVGDPAEAFPPERHDEIWARQQPLGFPETVYGVQRGTSTEDLMAQQSLWYGAHRDDQTYSE